MVCQVQIIPTPEQSEKTEATSRDEPLEVISFSSSIECTEIRTEAQTPEDVRASSQQQDAMPLTPGQDSLYTTSPPQPEQAERAISSR